MNKSNLNERSLEYHRSLPPGKLGVRVTKPCTSQDHLALAYSPGVAAPCREIAADAAKVWEYTARGNTVAVATDGTAVLGLGNIGSEAALPVMEGKAVLFKTFADVDAVPLCVDTSRCNSTEDSVQKMVETLSAVEPTYGGVNLEDISAPACFDIENTLKEQLRIPVFHDDQHGTAIISLAGVLNALELTGRQLQDTRIVINGAGAAGIACAEFYIAAGVRRENIILCDSKGVIHQDREPELTPRKRALATALQVRTLAEALKGADVFIGLSVADCVSTEMVRSMADDPIIFAMANPDPEIAPEAAHEAGAAIVGTGRSDFPNQVNNVLGFPGIFRGALDACAANITESMKVSASQALAELAAEKLPEEIKTYLKKAYPSDAVQGVFDGEPPLKAEYVIPKPFDPRVVPRVARRVYEAAVSDGVAGAALPADMDTYEREVAERIGAGV